MSVLLLFPCITAVFLRCILFPCVHLTKQVNRAIIQTKETCMKQIITVAGFRNGIHLVRKMTANHQPDREPNLFSADGSLFLFTDEHPDRNNESENAAYISKKIEDHLCTALLSIGSIENRVYGGRIHDLAVFIPPRRGMRYRQPSGRISDQICLYRFRLQYTTSGRLCQYMD